jgi:two-component system response regulator RpfG
LPTVLIIDPERARRNTVTSVLGRIDQDISFLAFDDPDVALDSLSKHTPDLIVFHCRFAQIRAGELVRIIRQQPEHSDLPLLVLATAEDHAARCDALEAGATDVLTLPMDELECTVRCRNLLAQRRQQKIIHNRACWLERRVAEATGEILKREHETLLRLARAGEYRDEDTGNHVVRMARYSRIIAHEMGLPDNECAVIEMAAPMHDIGKIGIPDEILRKPGRLTHREFEVMKTHARIGYEILRDSPSEYLQMGAIIALNHHEKYNGTGYPNRLGKDEIPLIARIVSVADAYDALTSERPYKHPWPVQKAVDYLNQQRGKFFDPDCLDAFMAQLQKIIGVQQALVDVPLEKRMTS